MEVEPGPRRGLGGRPPRHTPFREPCLARRDRSDPRPWQDRPNGVTSRALGIDRESRPDGPFRVAGVSEQASRTGRRPRHPARQPPQIPGRGSTRSPGYRVARLGWPGRGTRPGRGATRGVLRASARVSTVADLTPLAAAPPGQASCPGPPSRGRRTRQCGDSLRGSRPISDVADAVPCRRGRRPIRQVGREVGLRDRA